VTSSHTSPSRQGCDAQQSQDEKVGLAKH